MHVPTDTNPMHILDKMGVVGWTFTFVAAGSLTYLGQKMNISEIRFNANYKQYHMRHYILSWNVKYTISGKYMCEL